MFAARTRTTTTAAATTTLALLASGALGAGCQGRIGSEPAGAQTATPTPVTSLPGHEHLAEDTTTKAGPRLMPAEVYIRSYMELFGGLAPADIQTELSRAGLLDGWLNYLQVLGLPDYRVDMPRGTQTNSLMVAAFERIGIALCDRSVLHDLRGGTALAQRVVFRFDPPAAGAATSAADFAQPFDVLHRRILGYPAAAAPTDRTTRFYALFQQAAANQAHPPDGGTRGMFTPAEAAWAAVCYGLIRHPEFHLY